MSHRAVVDKLCRRRRRNQSADEDLSSIEDSPSSNGSVSASSSDEAMNEEQIRDILAVWSSRFLLVTEQLTTGQCSIHSLNYTS